MASSMTDTSPSSLIRITPTYSTLNNILMTGFSDHVQTDSAILEIASFDWGILDGNTVAAFIVCVNGGRPGVEKLLRLWNVESSEPLWARNKMTCYMGYSTESKMTSLLDTVPEIQYMIPMSGLYQIEEGLINMISSHGFTNDSVECESGIRFLTPLSYVTDRATNLPTSSTLNLMEKIRTELHSFSSLTSVLKNKFYWLATENLASQERTTTGQTWLDGIKSVLEGNTVCDFSNIRIYAVGRLVVLENLCGVAKQNQDVANCLLTVLAYLSTLTEATHIENVHQIKGQNTRAARITQSGNRTLNGYPYWNAGINGTGQLVQVFDTGIFDTNCYFKDTFSVRAPVAPNYSVCAQSQYVNMTLRKVVQIIALSNDVAGTDNDGHGTHVAGSIAGYNPGTTPGVNTFAGVAPAAKISMFYSNVPRDSNYSNIMKCTYDQGARLSSFSFGTVNFVAYNSFSLSLDEYLYYRDEVMHFNGASNDGNGGKATRSISAWGNPKNIVCVGASDNWSNTNWLVANMSVMAPFSSIGPVPAGRLKPDIAAPGYSVVSAKTNTSCGTVPYSGTSMATPVASGTAALIRQYYMDGFYPTGIKTPTNAFTPSGALIKATMITSAKPMEAYYIDYYRGPRYPLPSSPNIWAGFGLVQLQRVLRLNNDPYPILYLKDRMKISEGQTHTYKFSIPSITKVMSSFEISIVWTDPPSNVASGGAVLNNLDITATLDSDTKKKLVYPNANSGPDVVNNVEKIVLNDPKLGDVVTIKVTGTSVPVTATQNYSMVATGVYVPAAWYCQDTRSIRPNTLYTTSNCRIACQTFKRNPICCVADKGDFCTAGQASDAHCIGLTKPSNC